MTTIETKACKGAATKSVRMGMEYAQECKHCGTRVRKDLVDHSFFGFAAGCEQTSNDQCLGHTPLVNE